MKFSYLLLVFLPFSVLSQVDPNRQESILEITRLIDHYSHARESQDSAMLRKILTEDIDQLVSNGEWRTGIQEAIAGMQRSSSSSPGSRTLQIEKIKFLEKRVAMVDCRYTIIGAGGTKREMWSSFLVVRIGDTWKISAIRNMNPTGTN